MGVVLAAVLHPLASAAGMRDEIKDFDVDARWIYDDIERGRALAVESGKPLLVTFRCVPCEACRLIDFKVRRGDRVLADLLDRFVCVRIIQMKGVDLDAFQFDFDLSWAAVMLHPDGTVYGRYGTRAAGDSEAWNTQRGFARALERALALHAGYPANRAALAAKQPRPGVLGVRRAEEFPGLRERAAGPVTRDSCLHCHMVWDEWHAEAVKAGRFTREMLWKYPFPSQAGLGLDPDDGLRLRSVTAGSPAQRAGLRRGDRLRALDGTPLLSIADVQWILHHAPSSATLAVEALRSGVPVRSTLALASGWKPGDISWRASLYSLRPREHFWAPALGAKEKRALGLDPGALALKVRWVPDDSTARPAGLREGDVIVAVDGRAKATTPGELSMYVRLEKRSGDTLDLTVLRDGRRESIRQRLE